MANFFNGMPFNANQPVSLDPRMTIAHPNGPGSANYVRASSTSITRSEESTSAPTVQFVDIGTPNYAPAPGYNRVIFSTRSDIPDAGPQTRGILLSSLLEQSGIQRLEGAAETPLELPAAEADHIVMEIHWPGYARLPVNMTIAFSRNTYSPRGRIVWQHFTRAIIAQKIAEQAVRYVRMAQPESHVPSPVPLGTTSTPGVTTSDMWLRSLDPLISPEGRVVWVPHFAARYPLGQGNMRPTVQRTRLQW